ncbi:type II secretion system protein GspE [Candidatus Poribacteria bacterium]|nr:type II secretion system protein GspE [Candidatus Poribacteria bacterium]
MAKASLNKRYEEILQKTRLLTMEQLQKAIVKAEASDEYLHQVIVDMHFLDSTSVLEAAAREWGIGYVELLDEKIDAETVKIIPEAMARRVVTIPINRTENTLAIAMADPFDLFALREIEIRTRPRFKIQPFLALPSNIKKKLDEVYVKESEDEIFSILQDVEDKRIKEIEQYAVDTEDELEIDLAGAAKEEAQQSYIISLVWKIIVEAIQENASDIHIEPFLRETAMRYRIDGDLQYRQPIPKVLHNAVVSRIKILAKANIAERRVPQDGRLGIKIGNRKIEMRVSIIPTILGESVVMRLLDKSSTMMPLSYLGFRDENLTLFEAAIKKPHGLILVSGPTGSGKSTTLVSALNAIKSPERKILTVENPVEYNIEGVVQVQTKEEVGLTFAGALRAFLRQDPDVIMVGEMRDQETASIAVRAALTGHLVFSTIHTNDAPSSITRLTDFGIDPFLVADSVQLIIAQRLIHTICKNCKVSVEPKEEEIKLLESHRVNTSNLQLCKGQGCNLCNKGLRGRTGIHEFLVIDGEVRDLVVKEATAYEIKEAAMKNGMRTIREDGFEKVARGITSFEEVIKWTQEV